MPGIAFEELLRAGAQAGLFPEADSRVDEWLEQMSARRDHLEGREQHMANDLWLQITDHRTPDGGVVAVYTDISELKRRERGQQLRGDRWLQISGHRTADGSLVSIYTDISVIKARERELADTVREAAAARTRLSDAIGAVSEGFALFDADDRLVICNDRYRDIYAGVADVIVPGTTFENILRTIVERDLIPAARLDPEAFVEQRLWERRETRGTREYHLDSGRWVQIRERRTEEGGIVGINSDITELKGQALALAQARDAALEANQTKSQFLANMSHELRTPLNAIIGLTEMLHEDAQDDDLEDYLEPLQRIERAGKHLLHLINEVLDLSKIEAGRIDLHIESFDLPTLVSEVVSTTAPLAEKNGNPPER